MRYTSELITVAYNGDLATLYYHALGLHKFWQGEKKWTIAVEDKVHYQRVIDWINKNIIPEMTGWEVNVIEPPLMAAVDGWHRQQIIKLWVAGRSDADYSIILDCKNFLIRNVGPDEFFKDGKPNVGLFYRKPGEAADPTHTEACRILGVEQASEVQPITPFVWCNSIVRNLLAKLNSLNYDILIQPIIKASEAALYWVYAQDKEEWVSDLKHWSYGQYGGVTSESRLSAQQLRAEFKRADNEDAFMITMHRFHITPENADILSEYLRTKDLVGDWKIAFFRNTFKECLYNIRPEVIDILYSEWNMPPLRTIVRDGKTVRFNRIVAYGCSHTAGSELVDHLFWARGAITVEELDKIKRQYIENEKRNLFYNIYPELGKQEVKEAQSKVSWAGQVATRFGVPIVNRAIPGSSMQGIVYSIENDLAIGAINENDLILVGATSMDRWFFFSKEEENGRIVPGTPIVGWPDRWPTERFYDDFVEHIASDYFLMYNYQNAMRYLDLLNIQLGGRVCVQFLHSTAKDYIGNLTYRNKEAKKENNRVFLNLFNGINNYKSIIDKDTSFSSLVNWNDRSGVHGFYHPHVKYHEQLADIVMNKLLNNE